MKIHFTQICADKIRRKGAETINDITLGDWDLEFDA
jgi:hypothetical protein